MRDYGRRVELGLVYFIVRLLFAQEHMNLGTSESFLISP